MARQALQHQIKELAKSSEASVYALFWEQRCMKTGVVIRTAAQAYRASRIDACLVIAFPSGVHRVWADEWPLDWSEDLPYKIVVWRSSKMETVANKQALEELLKTKAFAVLTMNCEALLTKTAWNYLARFLKHRRLLIAADESSWASSPSAARTKRLLALGRHPNVIMKRILDGTPCDESPLNLYAPCAFLDPKLLGFSSFYTFRRRYAVLEEGYAPGGRTFQKVTGYQNLPELQQKLSKFSSRLRRADISDAPPKTYESVYFEMTPKQKQVYENLRDTYITEIHAEPITIPNLLTRLIRLQMISRNYYPPEQRGIPCPTCGGYGEDANCDRCDGLGVIIETTKLARIDPDHNPALDALTARMQLTDHPTVIWALHRQDVLDVTQALIHIGRRVARYDGGVPEDEREEAYQGFRAGRYDDIVATIDSGLQRGKDLTRALTLGYYSNSYSLRKRRQSEDRTEGLLRTTSTSVFDLIAIDTNDTVKIQALREKRSIAEALMGDPPEKWL